LISIQPAIIVLSIAEVPEIEIVHGLLMNEAFSEYCGKSLLATQLLQ